MKKPAKLLPTVIGLGLFLLDPLMADVRVWKDASGKHNVEAEFVSLEGDNVGLKTPSGRLIKLSLAKLSEEDRAIAVKLAASDPVDPPVPAEQAANPAVIPSDDLNVSAKGILKPASSSVNGKQKKFVNLSIVVTALGGIAADAYAVGRATVNPLTVDGVAMKSEESGPSEGFKVVDRSLKGIFAKHPKNGIRAEFDFGEISATTKAVGPVKGSVKVLAGGTEKEVAITGLLTLPVGILDDPALKAAGLKVIFTRKIQGDDFNVELEMNSKDSAAFVALEMVDANGDEVNNGSASANVNGTAHYLKSGPKAALEGAILKFRFRQGAKEMEIPFDIPEVMVAE